MYPDEDLITIRLARRAGKEFDDMREEARALLFQNRHLWSESLEDLGNCSYRGTIPKKALTRYVVFNAKARPYLTDSILSPNIIPENYLTMGAYYRDLVAWFFGDIAQLPQLAREQQLLAALERPDENGNHTPPEFLDEMRQAVEHWQMESQNREGIEVVDLL